MAFCQLAAACHLNAMRVSKKPPDGFQRTYWSIYGAKASFACSRVDIFPFNVLAQ
jgi:hypothetical protein